VIGEPDRFLAVRLSSREAQQLRTAVPIYFRLAADFFARTRVCVDDDLADLAIKFRLRERFYSTHASRRRSDSHPGPKLGRRVPLVRFRSRP